MIGKNLLKLTSEDGHSLQTMVSTYAAWTERATDADVAFIRQAMSEPPCPMNIDGGHESARLPRFRPAAQIGDRGDGSTGEDSSPALPAIHRPSPRFNPPRISWRSPRPPSVDAAKAAATR